MEGMDECAERGLSSPMSECEECEMDCNIGWASLVAFVLFLFHLVENSFQCSARSRFSFSTFARVGSPGITVLSDLSPGAAKHNVNGCPTHDSQGSAAVPADSWLRKRLGLAWDCRGLRVLDNTRRDRHLLCTRG